MFSQSYSVAFLDNNLKSYLADLQIEGKIMDPIPFNHVLSWLVRETVENWMLFHDEIEQAGNISSDLHAFALNSALPLSL